METKLRWEYSRNQLRHTVSDGEIYKHNRDFYQLFEIRTDRSPYTIRQRTDLFRLLHKGKQVDSHRTVKVLKQTAEYVSKQ